VNIKQERIRLLERQIDRLKRRIERLEQKSNRLSWMRVLIFFGGGLLSVAIGLLTWYWGIALGVVTLVAFFAAAHLHAKVDSSLSRHEGLLRIKTVHVARMRLDWEQIPEPTYSPPSQAEHPFALDLDIVGKHSLYRLLNQAFSRDGSERLLSWLLTTSPRLDEVQRRQALVRELRPLSRFRDRLLLNSLISTRKAKEQVEGKRLLAWLKKNRAPAALRPVFWILLAIQILTPVLFVVGLFTEMMQLWPLSLLAALILFFLTANLRGDIFDDASYMSTSFGVLRAVFEYLEKYRYDNTPQLKQLCEPFFKQQNARPSVLLKGIGLLADMATLKSNGLLWLLVNAFVPWDMFIAYRLGGYKEQLAQHLPQWLDSWFELEAVNSLATFAYLNPEYTLPEVVETTSPLLEAEHIGHPLLLDGKKVTNSFTFSHMGEVDILTGSNMAGKSTFLRTLGVNLCLAYAGAPVNATRMRTGLYRLFTCIRVSDSVTDGYSYFYAEVRRLRQLLDALDQKGYPLIFFIDEIFKGTNNRERLRGSRAFVRAVAGRLCAGMISTHDLELVKLAEQLPDVRNYHFREEVVNGQMVFDYKLRQGPCPTTNALKIMQMEGLPVDDELQAAEGAD
jgi:uncharacterized membrane protein YphA (DoxX/SURF4 family)